TMILGGIWHGANWTFAIWGAIHACGITACHCWRHFRLGRFFPPIPRWVSILVTFHLVCVTWVFFRAPDFTTAGQIFKGLFTAAAEWPAAFISQHAFILLLLAVFYVTHQFDDFRRVLAFSRRAPRPFVWATVSALVVLALSLTGGNSAAFIY